MAKYGRYQESKGEQEQAHRAFLIMISIPFVIGIVGGLTNFVNSKTEAGNSSIATCAQAPTEWEAALNARDAITPTEAVISSGRAKWEQLRDYARDLQQVKENLCN